MNSSQVGTEKQEQQASQQDPQFLQESTRPVRRIEPTRVTTPPQRLPELADALRQLDGIVAPEQKLMLEKQHSLLLLQVRFKTCCSVQS